MRDQALQMRRIKQFVGVRKRALADGLDREMSAKARRLAGIFDTPQGPKGRVEKRQQVNHHHIVVVENPVRMGVMPPEIMQIRFEQLDVFTSHQMPRPRAGNFLTTATRAKLNTYFIHPCSRSSSPRSRKLRFG